MLDHLSETRLFAFAMLAYAFAIGSMLWRLFDILAFILTAKGWL